MKRLYLTTLKKNNENQCFPSFEEPQSLKNSQEDLSLKLPKEYAVKTDPHIYGTSCVTSEAFFYISKAHVPTESN